jgi:hypothetical protein
MSYCPVFDNNCFSANSTLFILAFKSLQKSTSSNSKATSHGLGSKGPDEWEAHKKLRARKEELKKLTDNDDIIKHDKHHAANLLSRLSLDTFTDCDVIVTAVTCSRPPPSLSTNPPQSSQPHTTQPQMNTLKRCTAMSHTHQVVANATTLNTNTPHHVPTLNPNRTQTSPTRGQGH